MNDVQEMTDREDKDKYSTAETTKFVDWHLIGKENAFVGTYDMRTPCVTPSQRMLKQVQKTKHYSEPTGIYNRDKCHAAKSSNNATRQNEPNRRQAGKGA